jgi:hypothetical protein
MNPEQIEIGIMVIVAVVAIAFVFRKTSPYVDLERHPPEEMRHGLRLGTTWEGEPTTRPLTGNLTFSAGMVGRPELSEDQKREDAEFDAALEKLFGDRIQHRFYQKVVGVKHLNQDQTRRSTIIKRCAPLEILRIEQEPNNPVDVNAVAVLRQDGSQLGYLPARNAFEIRKDFSDPASKWVGIFRRHTHHPETGHVAGAVIVLALISTHPDPHESYPVEGSVNGRPWTHLL